MAAYFFDSSALVKRYVVESGTQWVRGLCAPAAGHTIYVVRITGAEVMAALARRTRTGSLTQSSAQRTMAAFRNDFGGSYLISELTPALVERAMDLVPNGEGLSVYWNQYDVRVDLVNYAHRIRESRVYVHNKVIVVAERGKANAVAIVVDIKTFQSEDVALFRWVLPREEVE
jgi:predicted nucleic acid-binding protein